MLLVVDCIAVRVFGSLPEPVRPNTKGYGTTETVAEVVPQIIGDKAFMWAKVSIETWILKIGLVPIHALIVTVIVVPVGIDWLNPEIWIIWLDGTEQARLLEFTVEVRRQIVPCWKQRASLLICKMKVGSSARGRTMVNVMYCTVFMQNSIGVEGVTPYAVVILRVGVQLTVWKGILSSLTSRGVMELYGRLQTEMAPAEIQRGLYMLEMVNRNCRPTVNCSLKITLMMLGLTTIVDMIWGRVPDTAIEATCEETVKVNCPEMVKRKVERGVGQATPMVTSMRKVLLVTPGSPLI